MKNEWNHTQILRGSFSAVWIATIASQVTFYSIFQALQDKQTFAPFTFQNFSEKTSKFLPEWKWNFIFHPRFSMNFAIFRRNFDENLPEFHGNYQEMTKCIEILRKSATKIRKMLKTSGICEKCSFFISFFHSCPYHLGHGLQRQHADPVRRVPRTHHAQHRPGYVQGDLTHASLSNIQY